MARSTAISFSCQVRTPLLLVSRRQQAQKRKRWICPRYTTYNQEADATPYSIRKVLGPTHATEQDLWTESTSSSIRRVIKDIHDHTTLKKPAAVDYATLLDRALRIGEPNGIIRALDAARRASDFDFVASIEDDKFTSILRLIQPSSLLGELADIHLELSYGQVKRLNIKQMHDIIAEYVPVLLSIVHTRRYAGCKLNLEQYAILLNSTKLLHLKKEATTFWQFMADDGEIPDTECYNGYLGSIIWEAPLDARARYRDRVNAMSLFRRQAERLFDSYRTFRTGSKGVFAVAENVFGDMIRSCVYPNTETYCIFIRAASLEGKLDVVNDILQRVWGIDAARVIASEDPTPTSMSASDPTYPTLQLLFEVARAYCINSDLVGALKLSEYISHHYNLKIDAKTWSLLLEWGHVLSIHRRSWEIERSAGKMDSNTVSVLWDTMSRSSDHVKPSMEMYDKLVRSTYKLGRIESQLEGMREYRQHFESHIVAAKRAAWANVIAVRDSVATFGQDDDSQYQASAALSKAMRQWELAHLRTTTSRMLLQSWVHYLLRPSPDYALRDLDLRKTAVVIPRMLLDWQDYANPEVTYHIPTGKIELQLRTGGDAKKLAQIQQSKIAHREPYFQDDADRLDADWIIGNQKPNRRALDKLMAYAEDNAEDHTTR